MTRGHRSRSLVKTLSITLVGVLLLTLMPAVAAAGAPPQDDPGQVTLEQAIMLVKANFTIPKECTHITSGYSEYDGRRVWSLNWDSPGEPGGGFNAQVDVNSGEILNVNSWRSTPNPTAQFSVVAVETARATALGLLGRLIPGKLPDLKLVVNESEVIPISSYGPVVYSFRWQRMLGGIPVTGDGVTVGVNAVDGTVANYYLNWSSATFPAAEGVISAEQARAAFEKVGLLELQYFRPSGIRPLSSAEKQPITLVYKLEDPSQGAIDAFTGEPVRPETGQWFGFGGGGDGAGMSRGEAKAMDSAAPQPLTPEEQKEVEQAAKLLTRDQAMAAAMKFIEVPEGLTLYGANLIANWQDPNIRIWNFNWHSQPDSVGIPVYMSASVNATNGELLNYDFNSPSDTVKTGKIDRPGAQALADEFIKKVQPTRVEQVRLNDRDRSGAYTPLDLKDGENPPQQYFNYRRMVNGIPFPANGMSVTVDAANQKVIRFNLSWQELDFPKADGILDATAANTAFLAKRPLTLSYALAYDRFGPTSGSRLVYQPTTAGGGQSYDMIDARGGEPLDYQGKPISQLPQGRRFNDIKGNFAEYEITLLGRAGLFGEYGDSFRPDEKITVISLLRSMICAKDGLWQSNLTDDEVIKAARDRNWLKEDVTAKSEVSRELMAKLMVRYLGLDQAARIEGIYAVPYTDASSLTKGTLGYVALAWGLGIITGDGKAFSADQPITRAQAAATLVRTLKVTP